MQAQRKQKILGLLALLLLAGIVGCPSFPGTLPEFSSCTRQSDCGNKQRCEKSVCVASSSPAEIQPDDDVEPHLDAPPTPDKESLEDAGTETSIEKPAQPDATPEQRPPEPSADTPDCTPTLEVCDNADNDCDGSIDEGNVCACVKGEQRECFDFPEKGTADVGECRQGIETCLGNGWSACVGAVKPIPETCNNKDDDCDGQIDNIPLTPQNSCAPTTPFPSTHRCLKGQMQCRGLRMECVAVTTQTLTQTQTTTHEGYLQPCNISKFRLPNDIALDSKGNIYVVDSQAHNVRKITPRGYVITIGGGSSGQSGHAEGIPTSSRFNAPTGIAIDQHDDIYIADNGNHRIRKISYVHNASCRGGGSSYTGYCTATLAGKSTQGQQDGKLSDATFNRPHDIVVAPSGIIYVAETGSHNIRKIDVTNDSVSVFAGTGSIGAVNATGNMASFNFPTGLLWHEQEQALYVADSRNHQIRKISTSGVVTTYAGTTLGSGGTNVSNIKFNRPQSLALTKSGALLISDRENQQIRQIDTLGTVTNIAGIAGQAGNTNGDTSIAKLNHPAGLLVDAQDRVLFADLNSFSIRMAHQGVVRPYAGVMGQSGNEGGRRLCASVSQPTGVAQTPSGTIYISDYERHVIYKLEGDYITLFAGIPGKAGNTNQAALTSLFDRPAGLALDSLGNLYVADVGNHRIRKIDTQGVVTTYAGSSSGYKDDPKDRLKAEFRSPWSLAFDKKGHMYVSDQYNHKIRVIDSNGVTTFANPKQGDKDNELNRPLGLLFDNMQRLLVADHENHAIKAIDAQGKITLFAGKSGTSGSADDSDPKKARFSKPIALLLGPSQDVYVVDAENHTIRRIDPNASVSTHAGRSESSGSSDMPEKLATYNNPRGATFNKNGDLLILDYGNRLLRLSPKCP